MEEQRDSSTPEIGRRRLLRRASGVAAGVAGATVVGAAVMPQAASAASGGNLVLGQTNTADTNGTTLTTNTGSSGALELSNTNLTTNAVNGFTVDNFGAPLRLVPAAASTNSQAVAFNEVGTLGFDSDGTLWLCAEKLTADWVYTTFTANQLVPISPTRILDTRSAAGRAAIINASGNLDSQGRLLGGHAITVDLQSLVFAGTAVHANLTVVLPTNFGFASLLPGDQVLSGQPSTSNINYNGGDVTPNFALCAIGQVNTVTSDAVKIYSSATTHVLLDVFAFTVNAPGQVNPAFLPGAASASNKAAVAPVSRAELARTKKPDWAKK
jgi:hypothetical protein